MAIKHHRKTGPGRSQTIRDVSSALTALKPFSRGPVQSEQALEQAIEAERAQLLQAQALLKCLYQVLLYANEGETSHYADVANVVAKLLAEAVERLDSVRLRPLIEAHAKTNRVEEPALLYVQESAGQLQH